MRSFIAGLAIFLSFFAGVATLVAYPAHQVLLNPDRVGETVGNALQQSDLRGRVLTRLVPGYGDLPKAQRREVDRIAESSGTTDALADVEIRSDGTIDLSSLQTHIAEGARAGGQDRLADQLEARAGTGTLDVPKKYFDVYETARETVWQTILFAGFVTLLLYGIALLASTRRGRTTRSIGITLLLSTAVAAGLHWIAPVVVDAAGINSGAEAVALTMRAQRSSVLLLLAPAALVAVLLVVGGIILDRRVTPPEGAHR